MYEFFLYFGYECRIRYISCKYFLPLCNLHFHFVHVLFLVCRGFLVLSGLVAKLCLTLVTPWTVACQAPLSMGFSRQEHWSGLPFPSPGYLPNPGIEPRSPALQADSLLTELQGKPLNIKGQVYQRGNQENLSPRNRSLLSELNGNLD